jgi:hypothetical protein
MISLAELVEQNGTLSFVLALVYGVTTVGATWSAYETRRERLRKGVGRGSCLEPLSCTEPLSTAEFLIASLASLTFIRFLSLASLAAFSFADIQVSNVDAAQASPSLDMLSRSVVRVVVTMRGEGVWVMYERHSCIPVT